MGFWPLGEGVPTSKAITHGLLRVSLLRAFEEKTALVDQLEKECARLRQTLKSKGHDDVEEMPRQRDVAAAPFPDGQSVGARGVLILRQPQAPGQDGDGGVSTGPALGCPRNKKSASNRRLGRRRWCSYRTRIGVPRELKTGR